MVQDLLIFCCALFLVVKGATLATKYAGRLAESFCLSKYIVGFIVVAFISILPETLIAINAAIGGMPEFGLGTLFGSNVADLTLIVAILIIYAKRGIKIESKILKKVQWYPFFILLPLVFGIDGRYSRFEGVLLIVVGAAFYYLIFRKEINKAPHWDKSVRDYRLLPLLAFAMGLLLVGAHFTVSSAMALAQAWQVSPILIGMLVVSLGATMPELFFSLKSMKDREDGLAIGDILGTVLADATIVVGIIACINPFDFPVKIIYVTGIFMVVAAFLLVRLMTSGRLINRKEGTLLLIFWLAYAVIEFLVSR